MGIVEGSEGDWIKFRYEDHTRPSRARGIFRTKLEVFAQIPPAAVISQIISRHRV